VPPGQSGAPGALPSIPKTDDISAPREGWGVARPADSADALPEDDLAGASDLSDGLLLLLGAIVKRTKADVAVLHRMEDDGATVVCAHGPDMLSMLGLRTRLLDAAVVAAAGGHVVVAEPVAGPAGEATITRLRKLGVDPEGAVMLPIRPRGRLLGLLEVGKETRFTMREIAKAEDLVAAFVVRAESGGWV
jgi:hypothetical protein